MNIAIIIMLAVIELSIVAAFVIFAKYVVALSNRMDSMNAMYAKCFKQVIEFNNGILITFKEGNEIDKKILDAWKGIEERYSETYEEFKLAIDRMEGIDKTNTDIYAEILKMRDVLGIFEIKDSIELLPPSIDIPKGATCDDCDVACPCHVEGAAACSSFELKIDSEIINDTIANVNGDAESHE